MRQAAMTGISAMYWPRTRLPSLECFQRRGRSFRTYVLFMNGVAICRGDGLVGGRWGFSLVGGRLYRAAIDSAHRRRGLSYLLLSRARFDELEYRSGNLTA